VSARAGKTFGRRVAKLAINFEEILRVPMGILNQIKVFESSIVFINYCVIFINTYYLLTYLLTYLLHGADSFLRS